MKKPADLAESEVPRLLPVRYMREKFVDSEDKLADVNVAIGAVEFVVPPMMELAADVVQCVGIADG